MGQHHFILSLVECFLNLNSNSNRKNKIWFGLYAFLATGARYESLFILAIIASWFLIKRQFGLAVISIVPACIPILSYGIFSLVQSGSFLPDSIRIKGNFSLTEGPVSFVNNLIHSILPKLDFYYYIKPILLLLLIAFFLKITIPKKSQLNHLIAFTFFAFILHISFADLGWNNRYEFYLVSLSVILISIKGQVFIREALRQKQYILVIGSLLICSYFLIQPIVRYNIRVFKEITPRMDGTYIQQHQMAKFVSTLPVGSKVVINDLGVITFSMTGLMSLTS